MTRFLLTRLGGVAVVMALVAVLVFVLTRAAPGDPIAVLLGDRSTGRIGKLPRTYHVWPHGKYEVDEAKLAAFKPDAYQAKMTKWMFKHMSMNASATLDEEKARYLETVAWETWQKVSPALLSGSK